jgi:hypothetical protein
MEFKLFNLLLCEADIDKKRHVYNTEDQHGNVYPHRDIKFDRYNTHDSAVDVYGDKSVVVKFKVNSMRWWNHKEDAGFDHGINTLDIEEILLNGKPIFTEKNNRLPDMDMTKWDGDPAVFQNLGPGLQEVIKGYEDEGNQEAVDTYIAAVKAKPSLWNDIGRAMVSKYEELDDAPPTE